MSKLYLGDNKPRLKVVFLEVLTFFLGVFPFSFFVFRRSFISSMSFFIFWSDFFLYFRTWLSYFWQSSSCLSWLVFNLVFVTLVIFEIVYRDLLKGSFVTLVVLVFALFRNLTLLKDEVINLSFLTLLEHSVLILIIFLFVWILVSLLVSLWADLSWICFREGLAKGCFGSKWILIKQREVILEP